VPRTALVVKSVCLNQFLFDGRTAKRTALREAEIRMAFKVLISRKANYEFVGQMSDIRGLDRAHDISGFPLLIGGNLTLLRVSSIVRICLARRLPDRAFWCCRSGKKSRN
jgi:hypothetical protein